VYWDPLPTVTTSAQLPLLNYEGELLLGPPAAYLRGRWEQRDWRNVPGPFYGAETDSCWMGRLVAPGHIVYEDGFGGEVVYRQPRNPHEVHLVLTAAWNDPFGAYACDGDDHWTPTLVREWWADRGRLAAWLAQVCRKWMNSERADERENALGLRDYADYLDHGLETHLREYAFWLDNHRAPAPGETLPALS
jgi:hypothetical protein